MHDSSARVRYDHDHLKWSNPVLAVLAALFFLWFLSTGINQMVAAVTLIAVGLIMVAVRPVAAMGGTLVYLTFMGDIRRYVSAHTGLIAQDPLLLVGPVVIGALFARLIFERKIRPDTPLAKLIIGLMVIMTLEILNPLQGGIAVGAAGALYYLVPLLWFWAGRSLPTEGLSSSLLKVVLPILAAVGAVLGLYQTLVHPLAFEAQWIRDQIANGFNAMVINGAVARAFSFFTSPAEYAGFLGLGIACCAVPLVVGRFRAVSLLIPLLAWAMVLESIRSAILLVAVATVAIWSLVGRNAEQVILRGFLAVIVGGAALYYGLQHLEGVSGNDRIQTLLDHTGELGNPGASTAEGHWSLALTGVAAGLKNPVGGGLGATTMAAQKFNTRGGGGFENDVANMFASLGVFGGLLYVAIILYILWSVYTLWRDRRSFAALAVFGILVSQLGYWLEGGHYALAAICWFFIGSIDRVRASQVLAPASAEEWRRAQPPPAAMPAPAGVRPPALRPRPDRAPAAPVAMSRLESPQ